MSTTDLNDLEMVQDAAALGWAVWRRTDFDSVSARRNLDDEFGSKIRSAAYTGSVAQFIDRRANRWGVRALADQDDSVREIVHRYDSDGGPSARAFLRTVRDNNRLVVLEMKHQYQTDDS